MLDIVSKIFSRKYLYSYATATNHAAQLFFASYRRNQTIRLETEAPRGQTT